MITTLSQAKICRWQTNLLTVNTIILHWLIKDAKQEMLRQYKFSAQEIEAKKHNPKFYCIKCDSL